MHLNSQPEIMILHYVDTICLLRNVQKCFYNLILLTAKWCLKCAYTLEVQKEVTVYEYELIIKGWSITRDVLYGSPLSEQLRALQNHGTPPALSLRGLGQSYRTSAEITSPQPLPRIAALRMHAVSHQYTHFSLHWFVEWAWGNKISIRDDKLERPPRDPLPLSPSSARGVPSMCFLQCIRLSYTTRRSPSIASTVDHPPLHSNYLQSDPAHFITARHRRCCL